MNETKELVAFAHRVRYEDLPVEVVEKAKELFLDQIGVQLGCATRPWSKQVYDVGLALGGKPESTVVYYGDKAPATEAAFINASFGHGFELDDIHLKGHGHPGSVLVPTALAMAERQAVNGRRLLEALIAGYEFYGRTGWSISPAMINRGAPHYSTAVGPFAGAITAGKLLGLDEATLLHAAGIASVFSGGLTEYSQSSGSVKRILGAVAAQAAIRSALLAQKGMTGPTAPLEGRKALGKIYADGIDSQKLLGDLGREWLILDTGIKPYSCCGGIHAAIDATKTIIQDRRVTARDVEEVVVGLPKAMVVHVGTITEPQDITGSQFSAPFTLALTFLKGGNNVPQYTEENLWNREIREFSKRIRVIHNPEMENHYGEHVPATVSIKTKAGQVYEKMVIDAKGTPGNPMARAEIEEKFRTLASVALPTEKVERLVETIWKLDSLESISQLVDLLTCRP